MKIVIRGRTVTMVKKKKRIGEFNCRFKREICLVSES